MKPQQAKTLYNDPIGRWKVGEIGTLLEHDFEKYDYLLDLGRHTIPEEHRTGLLEGLTSVARQYYFYKNELEVLNHE